MDKIFDTLVLIPIVIISYLVVILAIIFLMEV